MVAELWEGTRQGWSPFAASFTGLAKTMLLLACYVHDQIEENSMKSRIIGLRVAGTVYALMALAQLGRIIIRPEVLVNGYPMPLRPSVLAFLLLAFLSVWMWSLTLSRAG
ncbi:MULTISPECIES: hypothetical protein [unclassified Pseudomonas]|uniref:hypothetical protein n=1 Tax=Pseudomonas sp. A-R-26 TaxID=2832404 RepID=UPI001CC149F2|nr:hypothetical protein [Pseudomonas sp. A-R-26]